MIINLLAGLLGLAFVTLAKLNSVKKDFKVANQEFVTKKFFQDELIGIIMSVLILLLMAITFTEWIAIKPQAANYVTIIFVLGGAVGSYTFLLFLGNSKKYIRKIIDEKTNIADKITTDDKP
jgi:uncharacterized membrane protein